MTSQLHGAVPERSILHGAAACAALGTILYIGATVLHGDPPIDDPRSILEHVMARPWWRGAHLVNILAVLLWMTTAVLLAASTTSGAHRGLARVSQALFVATGAVFAVYFGIHAHAFPTLAARLAETDPAARADVLATSDTVLTVLGSTAFTAQAMLGLSVLLLAAATVSSRRIPPWFGWAGILVGAGWAAGALAVTFTVIVPFTVAGWAWMLGLAVALWRLAAHVPDPSSAAPMGAEDR